MTDFSIQRERMVEEQIAARGVRSERVLSAMRRVPRERFLPEDLAESAYDDTPLPIGKNQTISQPYIVAFMIEAMELQGGEKVLEVGTGSGYAAAVLAEIAAEVFSIERIGPLAKQARSALAELKYDNVTILHGDGTLGSADEAPFDAIVVAAGGPDVPPALRQQLKIGGRLLIPVGTSREVQQLIRVTRVSETEFDREELAGVRFVPLVGQDGW